MHIWGPVNVFVMAYLGAGAWFYTGDHRPARVDPARLRRERAGRAPGRSGDAGRRHRAAREPEAIVRPQPVGYEKEPGRRHGSATVAGGTAGRGGRGAGGTATGPRPRKRV